MIFVFVVVDVVVVTFVFVVVVTDKSSIYQAVKRSSLQDTEPLNDNDRDGVVSSSIGRVQPV